MVAEEKLRFFMAPVVLRDFDPPPQTGSNYPTLKAGMILKPYAKLDNGDTLYYHPELAPRTIYGERVGWDYCFAVDKEGVLYGDTMCTLAIIRKWDETPEVEMRRVYARGSIKRELIYTGRAGDIINLTYHESFFDIERPGPTQELVYDLSKSKVIAFKGMSIEVIEADNMGIRFIARSPMAPLDEKTEKTAVPEKDDGKTKGVIDDI